MKVKKRDIVRWFSIALAIMLLFSYSWTGTGIAKSNVHTTSGQLYETVKIQPEDKINQDLKKSFNKNDQVTFLLKFKDQVNTQKVAENALSKKQKKSLTTAKAELTKRSVIVSALRSKAQETQYKVKDFLKKQEKQGNVKNYQSYFIVNMMAVTGTEKVAEQLSKMGEIEKILPNRTRHIIEQPNKVKNAVNSAVKKANSKEKLTENDTIEPSIRHIGAPKAWNMGIDGTGIVVGSIDTGVQWDHPALKEKYRGYNPDDPDNPDNEMNWLDTTAGQDTPYDDNGHGTHTVGTMVGSELDGSNQIGVAPGADWIAAKVFTSEGTGSDADLLEAGQWMLAPTDADGNTHPEMAPDVINNSWGGAAGKDEFYREMVTNWREAGIFPAFAAGNTTMTNPGGPGSVASPGNYPESFAVGATDNDDILASFSLRGPSPYDEIKPEIVAPGVNIRSSVPGSGYNGSYSGTSMAAPAVAGTVALLKQANSSLSIDDLEKILTATAKPLTDEEYPETPNNGYGHGGLQAGNAVASIVSGLGEIKGHVIKKDTDNVPVSATVTIQETGDSTKTNPDNGNYSFTEPVGKYTLEAEAYGFYPTEKTVDVNKDETTTANFALQEIPKGTLEGTITDKRTGDPIKGATVSLTEDAAIKPVQTDADGHYSLKAYEGDYTMHVLAKDHFSNTAKITIEGDNTTTQDLTLKPFVGIPGQEIGYDDGTGEVFSRYFNGGNGRGVRMSLAEGQDSAMVTGAKIMFADEWLGSGGDQIQVEIWDASGKDGAPGKKLAGPVDATAVQDGTNWTTVDLKGEGVVVDGDFYMVYIQPKDLEYSPILAHDRTSSFAYRSWDYAGGKWLESTKTSGNYMIRSLVSYEVPIPEITLPKNGSYTNNSMITVEGNSASDVTINILDNDKKVATTETDEYGRFSADIKLTKGENILTATASTDSATTKRSEPVTVTLDQDEPDLTISSPEDGMKTNKMAVKVNGVVDDDNLSWVKINGQKTDVNDDGTWSKRIILDDGENKIKVVARDKANNRTKKTRTVYAQFDAPAISSLEPDEDMHLKTGQSMIISFDSEPGLDASFTINAPLANPTAVETSSIKEYSMMETKPGHYIGVWTATNMNNVKGAKIQVTIEDDFGNVSTKEADGELFINIPESE